MIEHLREDAQKTLNSIETYLEKADKFPFFLEVIKPENQSHMYSMFEAYTSSPETVLGMLASFHHAWVDDGDYHIKRTHVPNKYFPESGDMTEYKICGGDIWSEDIECARIGHDEMMKIIQIKQAAKAYYDANKEAIEHRKPEPGKWFTAENKEWCRLRDLEEDFYDQLIDEEIQRNKDYYRRGKLAHLVKD